MLKAAVAGIFTVMAAAADASEFNGLYYPEGAGTWSCQARDVGSDGGALAVDDEGYRGVESFCALTNPVPVNGMEAVLYDGDCTAEGETSTRRMMLMRRPGGLYVITDGFVATLNAC